MSPVGIREAAFMGEPALKTNRDPLAIEGLEDLLEQGSPQGGASSEQDGTDAEVIDVQGGPQGGPSRRDATAEEAATLLGISVRAVLKRLNKGTLKGRKAVTKFGEKWLVDREELPRTIHVEVSEQDGPQDGPANEQGGTEARTSSNQGGPEGGPRQNEHVQQIVLAQSLSNQGELIATVLKQAQIIEQLTNDLRQKDDRIRLLSDSQHNASWFKKFSAWFLGR
jgi:hypothetical protein